MNLYLGWIFAELWTEVLMIPWWKFKSAAIYPFDMWQNAVVLWTYDPPERDARLAKEALKARKKGINHLQVIVEIACASSPHHLMSVRQAYCSLFESSLEEDITANVSLPLKKVKKLVQNVRYQFQVMSSQWTIICLWWWMI